MNTFIRFYFVMLAGLIFSKEILTFRLTISLKIMIGFLASQIIFGMSLLKIISVVLFIKKFKSHGKHFFFL